MLSVVVKDKLSAMVKYVRSSDVIGYGMVSHSLTSSCGKVWRALLSFLSRPADCGMQLDGVSFEESGGDMVKSMPDDMDGDGTVTLNELDTVMRSLGQYLRRPIRAEWRSVHSSCFRCLQPHFFYGLVPGSHLLAATSLDCSGAGRSCC